jgi:hypothetical protein
MIYFTSEKLTETDNGIIEKSIRGFSSKRNIDLDLKSTSVLIEDESRYFLGIENKKHLKITRIRGPFEKYFPKLIIRFSKSDFKKYDVRLSLITFSLTVLLVLILVSDLIKIISDQISITRFVIVLVMLLILSFLTKIEMKFVKRRINKAIKNTKETVANIA